MLSQGLDWDHLSIEAKLDMLRDAGATGRLGKPKNVERELWREQAAAIGWKHKTVMVDAEHDHLTDTERFDRAYTFAARHLAEEFHTAAALDHDKLRLYAARGLIGTGIRSGVGDIDRVVELIEQRGLRLRGEQVALIVGLFDDKVRVTNSAQVRIEETLAACAREAARDRSGGLATEALRYAIAIAGVRFTEAQIAAIYALGRSGKLTLLTGVAGAGKTTLLQPLVAAWRADTQFAGSGREVIGAATAWRQADALRDAGIARTFALQPLLKMIEAGEFTPTRNTVLVLDEVSQIAPRPMLKLLELQADTGMTIKMLGDPEQAQAIEAGDTIEILRRVLPPEALPELLATIRQKTKRGRKIARLFRDGKATEALAMKREHGTALMVGGDYDQVIAKIADLYVQRRDILRQAGNNKGITVTALTNDEVADVSRAIRARLKERGEIGQDEIVYRAIDQRGETYDLPIAIGDRLRLFRRTWGRIDGRMGSIGNNGDIVEVVGWSETGLLLGDMSGRVADVEWRRLSDEATNRLLVGFGHALTIDAAQGISSTEHINALTRGTSGVTAFRGYVAESRSEYTTWTVISEGAVYEAERHSRALGDITPITANDLWRRAAADLSAKPYKSLGVDILAGARRDRDRAIETFIRTRHAIESAQLDDPEFGHDALKRFRAEAVRNILSRHLAALDKALRQNRAEITATREAQQAHEHLMRLRAETAAVRGQLKAAATPSESSARPSALRPQA